MAQQFLFLAVGAIQRNTVCHNTENEQSQQRNCNELQQEAESKTHSGYGQSGFFVRERTDIGHIVNRAYPDETHGNVDNPENAKDIIDEGVVNDGSVHESDIDQNKTGHYTKRLIQLPDIAL
jgi:hypothetical protein